MELNLEIDSAVAESSTVELSPERLRLLLSQIEMELYRSQVYKIVLNSLNKMLGDNAPKGEILVRAVGREAIQLALKQLLAYQRNTVTQTIQKHKTSENGHHTSSPSPSSASSGAKQANGGDDRLSQSPSKFRAESEDSQPHSEPKLVEVSVVASSGRVSGTTPKSKSPNSQANTPSNGLHSEPIDIDTKSNLSSSAETVAGESSTPKKKKRKKLTPAELAAQATQKREACLRQLGQDLRQARESLSLSLSQLHCQTLVPLSHLQALEMGKIDQLPEDVYLRGFICRVGNALGLNGTAMAASIPAPDPMQHIVPTWSKANVDSSFYLSSVHLYVGYAAILAGSLGGIAWLSQQSLPESNIPPEIQKLLQEAAPHSKSHQDTPTPTPGLQSEEMDVVLGADIAPPQALSLDLMLQEMTSMGFSSYQSSEG